MLSPAPLSSSSKAPTRSILCPAKAELLEQHPQAKAMHLTGEEIVILRASLENLLGTDIGHAEEGRLVRILHAWKVKQHADRQKIRLTPESEAHLPSELMDIMELRRQYETVMRPLPRFHGPEDEISALQGIRLAAEALHRDMAK